MCVCVCLCDCVYVHVCIFVCIKDKASRRRKEWELCHILQLEITRELESKIRVVFSFPHGALSFFLLLPQKPPDENNKKERQLLDYPNIKAPWGAGDTGVKSIRHRCLRLANKQPLNPQEWPFKVVGLRRSRLPKLELWKSLMTKERTTNGQSVHGDEMKQISKRETSVFYSGN